MTNVIKHLGIMVNMFEDGKSILFSKYLNMTSTSFVMFNDMGILTVTKKGSGII